MLISNKKAVAVLQVIWLCLASNSYQEILLSMYLPPVWPSSMIILRGWEYETTHWLFLSICSLWGLVARPCACPLKIIGACSFMAVSWRKLCTGLAVRGAKILAAGQSWESAVTRRLAISNGKAFRPHSVWPCRCRESGRSWESRCWEVSLYFKISPKSFFLYCNITKSLPLVGGPQM